MLFMTSLSSMQSPCLNFKASPPFLGHPNRNLFPRVSCSFHGGNRNPRKPKIEKTKKNNGGDRVKVKEKENVWSVDNDVAKAESSSRSRKRGRRMSKIGKSEKDSSVLVSGAMLMEVETVLEMQEPVIKPSWNTFSSSVSGWWKGVGAVFSPITAEMEPIDIGDKSENLFDCYILALVEAVASPSGERSSEIRRMINWVTLNPHGEVQQVEGRSRSKEMVDAKVRSLNFPRFESFDFESSDVLEEDFMGMEPGLVFFEDGSYSRGPMDIPVGEAEESKYFVSPTLKFEQCLVKGCHKRLRIIHTIEFNDGGSDIQIMRVAVYEEQWVNPANICDHSDDVELDLKAFSQRNRIKPSELTGSWKVFETSATPILGEEKTSYVYLCTEALKKRSLPENPVHFGEEEILDMQDATVLWLPGGVTAYVDVNKDGILCIGVGWYSNEGINLVMERDYGLDGKLREVRMKSEVMRWPDSF